MSPLHLAILPALASPAPAPALAFHTGIGVTHATAGSGTVRSLGAGADPRLSEVSPTLLVPLVSLRASVIARGAWVGVGGAYTSTGAWSHGRTGGGATFGSYATLLVAGGYEAPWPFLAPRVGAEVRVPFVSVRAKNGVTVGAGWAVPAVGPCASLRLTRRDTSLSVSIDGSLPLYGGVIGWDLSASVRSDLDLSELRP